MRSQIPAAGSSESDNSQTFSSPIRKVLSSPSRKKESLADRVHRTRRHRLSSQPPSPTTAACESSQSEKSETTELVQTKSTGNMSTEHRQDISPKRKTIALAQAHRKSISRTGTPGSSANNVYQAPPTDDTARAVIATPMERAVIATPMEKKSPSLNEKKMRAIARVNKSPRRSPAAAATSGSLKDTFFSDEPPEKSVHAVVIQPVVVLPEADVSRKFASRYGQAASLSKDTSKAAASEPQPAVAESLPRYFTGSSVPKVPTANRYRLNNNKAEWVPAEEKKEEVEDIKKPEGAAPKTSHAEIEAPDKLNMANMKFRYGVSLYKEAEPSEQPKVQDIPALKRSGYNASKVFQPTEESKPHNPEPTLKKPDFSANSYQHRNPSHSEPTPVVPTPELVKRTATWGPRSSTPSKRSEEPRGPPEPVERPATWKPRSSTPSKHSQEPRGPPEATERPATWKPRSSTPSKHSQGASPHRGQVQGKEEEQVHHEIESNFSIETPDKVSVSNMKAMFGPAGIQHSEKKRAVSASRPRMTGRLHSATKTPETSQSKNVGTIRTVQSSEGNVSRGGVSTWPAKEAAVDHNEEMPTEDSRAVIETPEKISVSSMKGKFNTHGITPSFYRSTTPPVIPATPPKTVRPSSDVSTPHGPSPPQRAVYNSAPTTTESWQNRYPSPNQPKTKLTPPWTKRTPPTSDAILRRNASPLPPASHRIPSGRFTATEQQEVREVAPRSTSTEQYGTREVAPPPIWESPDPSTESVAMKEAHIDPQQIEEALSVAPKDAHIEAPMEQKTVSQVPEIIEAPQTQVPQSPRDRPSSIPKWEKPTKPASPSSPSTRPSSIPALPKREESPLKEAPEHSQERPVSTPSKAVNNVSTDREKYDSNPVRETIQFDARSPSPSPRNRERPWTRDLQTLSPRSWERRRESSFDTAGDDHQLKPRQLAQSSSPRKKVQEKRHQKPTMVEGESSYGEKGEMPMASTGSLMSLTQMAANSSHAVDYEQAMRGLGNTSVSYDDEESNDSGGTGGTGGAIPVDLPPEFARAIAQDQAAEMNTVPSEKRSNMNEVTHLISKARELQAKALSREKLDKACHGLSQTLGSDGDGHSIVFGDPNTYGTAGGDAGQTPPRVADRAKAIANWKGGLGVKPPPASKFDEIYDLDPSQSSPRDDEQIEDSYSDVVFGNPKTYGVAGGEATNESPRVVQRTHAIEEWTSSPAKSSDSNGSAPAVKSPGSRAPLSSAKSPGAKVTSSAPSGFNISGSKESPSFTRGTSAVMQFWASTSEDELKDAHNWADMDPVVEDMYATKIGDITPEEVEEQLADEYGFPKAPQTKTAGKPPSKRLLNNQAPDPFDFDAVAALSTRSTNNSELKPKTTNAFDPFFDGVTDAPPSLGGSTKFFTEETFSEPTFTPRANEEYMHHEFEQRGIGTTALAAPGLSSSEGSDPVTGQQVFSKYSKLGPPRSSRKSAESDRMKQQRRIATTEPEAVTEKPKQRMIVTDTMGIAQLSMSIETDEQRKERKLAATIKSTERKMHSETDLDHANNLSDSQLLFDPWSYSADAEPNTSFEPNMSGFGFEI
jgi:hypothetical protein